MGKYLFNPFTQNFTVIPKPQPLGLFTLVSRDGKLEWVQQPKVLTVAFTSTATREVSSVGILPRIVIARADSNYLQTIEDPGTYAHEILLDPAATNTSSYTVSVYLAPDQTAAIDWLPATPIEVDPVKNSSGANVAFVYQLKFTTDAAVSINAYDSP
jgi:hypothetical protein